MKTCQYCRCEVHDEAIRCPYCSSTLGEGQVVDKQTHITYVLDSDLVRFLKFSGSILAIFTVVGLFFYGLDLKQTAREIKETEKETRTLAEKMKETQQDVFKMKENVSQIVAESGTKRDEIRALSAQVKEISQSVNATKDEVLVVFSDITASRDRVRTIVAEEEGKQAIPVSQFGQEQVEQVLENKIVTYFEHVLTNDQYAKLKKALKIRTSLELQRLIYDAKNNDSLPGVLVRTEGSPDTDDPIVNQVYINIGHVYRFFKEVFKRNSLDDRGAAIVAVVHFDNQFNNGFWDGQRLVFGDGDGEVFNHFVQLSIVASQLATAVVDYSARLESQGQSGALGLHFSDVFGVLVEQWEKKQSVEAANWLVGDGLFTDKVKPCHPNEKVALRSIKAPGTAYCGGIMGKDPQPAHMKDYVKTENAYSDRHINEGIPNRAFYVAAAQIGGYAWEKAGLIWYQSLLRLKANSQFSDCAKTTYKVAGELFGRASPEQNAVKKGWNAVGISVKSE